MIRGFLGLAYFHLRLIQPQLNASIRRLAARIFDDKKCKDCKVPSCNFVEMTLTKCQDLQQSKREIAANVKKKSSQDVNSANIPGHLMLDDIRQFIRAFSKIA